MNESSPRAAQLLVIGGLASFGPLSLDLYLPALPRVGSSLGASAGLTQLSVSGCLIGLAVGQLIVGPLGDRFGRRRPLLAGVALWTLSALLCAVAPDAALLVIFRVLMGLGGAAGLVLSRAVIRDLYESDALARAFAVVALMSNVTPAIAPVAGGGLLQFMDWRGLFLVLTGIGVALLAGVLWFLPESLAPQRRRPAGLRETLAVGRGLMRDRLFRGAAASMGLASAMLFTYISLSSYVLQHQRGLSAAQYSLVFAANSVGIILVGALTVRLVRTLAPGRLLVLALAAAGAATLTLAVLAACGAPTWALLIALLCAISTIGATLPTATTLALLHNAETAGAGSALIGGSQYAIGGVAGPLVSLCGETAPAMAVAMAVFALSGWAVALVSRLAVSAQTAQ